MVACHTTHIDDINQRRVNFNDDLTFYCTVTSVHRTMLSADETVSARDASLRCKPRFTVPLDCARTSPPSTAALDDDDDDDDDDDGDTARGAGDIAPRCGGGDDDIGGTDDTIGTTAVRATGRGC